MHASTLQLLLALAFGRRCGNEHLRGVPWYGSNDRGKFDFLRRPAPPDCWCFDGCLWPGNTLDRVHEGGWCIGLDDEVSHSRGELVDASDIASLAPA